MWYMNSNKIILPFIDISSDLRKDDGGEVENFKFY